MILCTYLIWKITIALIYSNLARKLLIASAIRFLATNIL